jgi:hypothetical protein
MSTGSELAVGHRIGPMGWGEIDKTTNDKRRIEASFLERAINDNPIAFEQRAAQELRPVVKEKFDKLQDACGRGPNSCDMTLLDTFIFEKHLNWFPQDIGSCFKAGTMIRMADGSQKRIEDVRPFDQVLTAEGGLGKVVEVRGRDADEPMYQVKLWGHFEVEMTGEHPILTKRGYVVAKELRLDDYVAVTRYIPNVNAEFLHTHEHVRINGQSRRKYAKAGHCIGEHKTINGSVKVYGRVPEVIKLDYQFGWLCGIYVAEGSPDGNKVVWTFHKKELETHVKTLVGILKNVFDIEASVSFRANPKSQVCKVTVHSVAWSSMMESLCGKGSSSKGLHRDLTTAGVEFLEGMWDGWRDGDGHQRDHVSQGTTVSKNLALDMHAIANGLGLMPNIVANDPAISHGVKHRFRRYDIRVSGTEEKICCEQTDKCVWRKVRSIAEYNFTGQVYNFEVTGDNSYVADGLGVHNCVWSNTYRPLTLRMMFEIALRGDAEEYFGVDEHGFRSIAPHCVTYGFARQIANMRGGDGLYCSPMAKALSQGMVMCSTPKLIELHKASNADGPTNFPEPRSASLYRRIGDWAWNDALRPFLANPVSELVPVDSFDKHFELSKAFKPIFQCSSIAIRVVGKHKDGFVIHEKDPNNSWAHNMYFAGHFYASDGTLWFRFCNKSWLNDTNPEAGPGQLPTWNDQEEVFCYNISAEHLMTWYKKKLVDSMGIGEIDMPQMLPVTI